MNAVLSLAGKELRLLVRDKFALFWILAFPLMFALFFGVIFGDGNGGGRGAMTLTIVGCEPRRGRLKPNVPSAERSYHEPMPSKTSTGDPVGRARSASKGAAQSASSRMKRSCPVPERHLPISFASAARAGAGGATGRVGLRRASSSRRDVDCSSRNRAPQWRRKLA